ncbi:MAG TPA: CRTAC1 family protein [Thermoanaerobaculia bacterium]|nr:CRTAC1 family protein [Thermoanaerobaculia bacterium]
MPVTARPSRPQPATLLLAAALLAASPPAPTAAAQPAEEPPAPPPRPTVLQVPTDMGEDHLPAREEAQLATLPSFGVPADLRFADRLAASGIAFRHRMVDDAGRAYKPVHYDHGNAVAAADVDGDGRTDLYFTTQLGANELWRNAGGGRFEDWTERSGLGMRDRVSVGASFVDVDNDGDPDLFVTTVRKGNALFRNDGGGRFTEVTVAAGLAYSGHSSGAVFFDYDRDGWVDLFLVNVGRYTTDEVGPGGYYVGRDNAFAAHTRPELAEASVLYRNEGGRFRDVSQQALLVDRSWSGDAAAADLDGDGWTDLYVLSMQGSDRFWQNVRGEFFVDRSERFFPRTPPGSMGVEAFDWNRDGRLDLYVTDMHSDMAEELPPEREKEKYPRVQGDRMLAGVDDNILGNAFFQATAEGGFEEVSDAIGAETFWPWGISVDDLNADGWEDVFVTAGMSYPFRYGLDSVLLNDRGRRFRDAELIVGVEPRAELTQPWFEIDCPRRAEGDDEDAAPPAAADLRWTWQELGGATEAAADGVHPLCRGLSGPVEVVAAKSSRSSVIFDLEGDGDLDVVTNEFNGPPQVLVSDLSGRRPVRWIEVDLVGTRSNKGGLGAVVTVVAGGLEQMEPMDGKSGYLAQSDLPLWFGLGEATKVDRVEVAWPSGARQTIESPPIGRRLTVTEPGEPR